MNITRNAEVAESRKGRRVQFKETVFRNSIHIEIVIFGRRIAGIASPVIVIALKRNGAYPADIQLFAVGRCSRCLKVEQLPSDTRF